MRSISIIMSSSSTANHIDNHKVMVVGMDGLSLELLQALVDSGDLPTFRTLLERGAYGTLQSVTNMTTGPTWVSFSTGCQPARHGILHDFRHAADGYALQYNRGEHFDRPTFWQRASDAGQRVIVLNVPLTYPAQPVKGVALAGIDAPSEQAPAFSYPPQAYVEMQRVTGDYIIDCGLASYMQSGNVRDALAAVERETEGRTRAAEYFMQQAWKLFVTVYSLPDVWQHYYWTAAEGSPERERMLNGYRQMDQHLAQLLAHLPVDGHIIICSDHGFGRLLGTRDHVNRWLAEQGWLTFQTKSTQKLRQRTLKLLLDQIRQRISFRRRQQILASIPLLRRRVESQLRLGNIDWSHTQVYAAIDHTELWLNVRGRQAQGSVEPSACDALAEKVAAALLAWRDANDCAYLLDVQRHPYSGASDYVSQIPPDLSLRWNPDAVTPNLHPQITGDHAPDGAWIIAGPNVAPGRLPTHSLVDVAPTALRLLGLSTAEGMDGRVPPQID